MSSSNHVNPVGNLDILAVEQAQVPSRITLIEISGRVSIAKESKRVTVFILHDVVLVANVRDIFEIMCSRAREDAGDTVEVASFELAATSLGPNGAFVEQIAMVPEIGDAVFSR